MYIVFRCSFKHLMSNSFFSLFQSKTASKLEKVHEHSSHKTGSPRDPGGFVKVAKETDHGSQCSTPTEVRQGKNVLFALCVHSYLSSLFSMTMNRLIFCYEVLHLDVVCSFVMLFFAEISKRTVYVCSANKLGSQMHCLLYEGSAYISHT